MDKFMSRTLFSLSLCCAACGDDNDTGPQYQGGGTNDTGGIEGIGSSSESGAPGEGTGDTGDTGEPPSSDTGTEPEPGDPNEQIPPPDEEGCHAIYAQDLLPTFELKMHPIVWDKLQEDWLNGPELDDENLPYKFYYPLEEFRYEDIVITDAEIRLRGNGSYWYPDDKMQFQIGFHRNDHEHGRFLGLRRLIFDAATYNENMLRDRLALWIMRDAGIPAPCANHARLVVNGEYYGIFTNIEKLDEEYLERVFDDPTGDLWDRHGWELKTNEDTTTTERIEALDDADSPEELYTYLYVEQALLVFAAQAVIPDSDGPWAGGLNFFFYDDPLIGKFWLLPWDLDGALDRFNDGPNGDYPDNPDPVVWEKPTTHGRPLYDLMLEDDDWFELYIEYIGDIVEDTYYTEKLHGRINEWTEQIKDSVLKDENKPFSNEEYLSEVEDLLNFVENRHEWLVDWLECWQDGGEKDKDGYCEDP
jgi:spore coat protein CotH